MEEKQAKTDSVDDYLVYRVRLADLLELHGVIIHLEECNNLSERPADQIRALHLVTAGFLAGFFDTRTDSLNVFRLWKKYFPSREKDVAELEVELASLLDKLTELRHKVAAHADLSLAVQEAARLGLDGPDMRRLLDKFYAAATALLVEEAKIPALTAEIEERGLKRAFDRAPE